MPLLGTFLAKKSSVSSCTKNCCTGATFIHRLAVGLLAFTEGVILAPTLIALPLCIVSLSYINKSFTILKLLLKLSTCEAVYPSTVNNL